MYIMYAFVPFGNQWASPCTKNLLFVPLLVEFVLLLDYCVQLDLRPLKM